ncbi:MAG: DNA polymerase III subunit beta [Bacteroidales bacterium]|nr:DNA polymerase III subunit beta [Bacteroidales bacterium]MBR3412959.1 DNA polymerase III subunit beta [Bacteroidales bacterium]
MKFIINSLLFSKQIQSLSGVLTNSNTVPIINCFHFHLDEGMLTIRATDLETTLVSKVEVETGRMDDINDVAVPSKLLLDIIKSMDDVPMTFSVEDTTYGISITSGEGKYRIAGKNPETFPNMPEAKDTTAIKLTSSLLVSAISKTAFAASTDEMRPQMGGIFCDLTAENITFVATDAHKLVRYRRTDVTSDTPVSFILPRKPVSMMKSIMSTLKEDMEVTLEYNNTNAAFTFGNFYIICRLVDGRYPNYDAAIPKENPNKLTVDRNSFLNTLRRVGLFANQASHQVRLAIQERELVVSAEDLEFSNNAQEKLPCQYEGEPMEIGFNAKFLTEMVSNIETEQILIEMSHPSRAGIIFPITNEENSPEDILMLVMPVMLAN